MMEPDIDKSDMRSSLRHLPEQIAKGFMLPQGVKVAAKIDKIIIAGMGGSAVVGEMLKSYLPEYKIPIFIAKDYMIPEFANSSTLIVAISYSGNTEETLNAYRNAVRKGCKIITISFGGKLQMLSEKQNIPHVNIPIGLNQRLSYMYIFFILLRILQNSELVDDQASFVENTVEIMKKPVLEDRAKELAEQLIDKIPLIYSSETMKSISYKWKMCFNENSKIHAFSNTFPELNHNEMVGYTKINGNYYVILIRDEEDYERIRKRMDITKELIKRSGVPVIEIGLSGPCRLAKIISAIYIGEWASYYLAMQNKQDPSPVVLVEQLKEQL